MRSNSKAVRELVKSHILSYYETVESLKADLMALYIDHRKKVIWKLKYGGRK